MGVASASPAVNLCSREHREKGAGGWRWGLPRCPSNQKVHTVLAMLPSTVEQMDLFVKKRRCELRDGSWAVVVRLVFAPDASALTSALGESCSRLVLAVPAGESAFTLYEVPPSRMGPGIELGTWTRADGLHWTAQGQFGGGRRQLAGSAIDCITQDYWPLTEVRVVDGKISVGGFIGNVWAEIQRLLNFTCRWTVWDSENGGDFEMEALRSGGAEVAVRDVMAGPGSLIAAHITQPVASVTMVAVVRKSSGLPVRWRCFLEPFSARLWQLLLGGLAALAVGLAGLHAADPRNTQCLADALFGLVSAAVQQAPVSSPPPRQWQRLLLISIHLAAIAVAAGYSAALTSFLASGNVWVGPRDFAEMVASGDFKFDSVEHAKEELFIWESSHPQLRALQTRLELGGARGDVHSSYRAALTSLCRRQEPHALILRQDAARRLERLLDCSLRTLPGLELRLHLVLPLSRKSWLGPLINYHLNLLRERGVLSRLLRVSQPPRDESSSGGVADHFESVSVRSIVPPLAALGAVALCSLVLLLLECIWKKRQKYRRPHRGR